jgi:hypothetical protein
MLPLEAPDSAFDSCEQPMHGDTGKHGHGKEAIPVKGTSSDACGELKAARWST